MQYVEQDFAINVGKFLSMKESANKYRANMESIIHLLVAFNAV